VNYNQLLAKNYLSGRIPVIKATNVANNLLVDVLRYMPESKVLYLYSDLESFLISNLKKTADTQKKMAGLLAGFLLDNDFGEKYSAGLNIGKLSFLQICSLVWVVNLYSLQRAVGEVGAANVRTLDMATLLDDLPKTVSEVSRYFGHKSNAQELSSMMAPQVVSTHAKDQSQRFDVNLRGKEALIILDRFGREVTSVKQWIQPLIDELDLTSSIESRALMIGGSPSTGEVLC
jgi:hypothetical protein